MGGRDKVGSLKEAVMAPQQRPENSRTAKKE